MLHLHKISNKCLTYTTWGCAVCHNISIHTHLILPFTIYGLIFAQQIIAHTHAICHLEDNDSHRENLFSLFYTQNDLMTAPLYNKQKGKVSLFACKCFSSTHIHYLSVSCGFVPWLKSWMWNWSRWCERSELFVFPWMWLAKLLCHLQRK